MRTFAVDAATSNEIPIRAKSAPETPITPQQRDQAQEALIRRMAESENAAQAPTNIVPLTTKLIVAPADRAQLAPPSEPSEALRRKLDELKSDERKARVLPAPSDTATNAVQVTNGPVFAITNYEVNGIPLLPTNTLASVFSRYARTNVNIEEIVKAALELQAEYRNQGFPGVSVAFAPKQITNGVVKLTVFEAASPQIVVAGKRYLAPPVASTNPPAKFQVRAYEVTGDTLLSDETLTDILAKYTGTNIGVAEILKAGSELQMEYRDRGYPTVNVTIPPQQITNGTVKIRVFEGQLASIVVTNNHYFSADNVMRALPGLRTNDVLVGPLFQTELDRANANQDRQIYPQLAPGPIENTSELVLNVKDRLPLHGKIDFNNLSSPGTPDMRINASAAYNNLWQLEHSIGAQYSFSPQEFKTGDQWHFYDLPAVANYSTYYRLPLGNPEPVDTLLNTTPGSFGYDEATRKFRLPSPSGRPELNLYASRSTIDTGLQTILNQSVTTNNDTGNTGSQTTLTRRDVQQDLTVNNNIGTRLTLPMPPEGNWQSAFSAGGDFKTYQLSTHKTNIFVFTQSFQDETGQWHTNVQVVPTPVPTNGVTVKSLEYLPLSFRYDGSVHDTLGATSFGFGLNFNPWYSGSVSNLQRVAASRKSSGHWVTITPSISRDFVFHTNWTLSLRFDAQVASEPLISNEQYGVGGVNSVRGYREGEIFGDEGWHVGIEQKTPTCLIGFIGRNLPLTVRGSLFMDYAEAYLIDPQGRDPRTPLWGVGTGAVISVGTYWEARLLFSLPLLRAGSTEADQPRFNFALTGQF